MHRDIRITTMNQSQKNILTGMLLITTVLLGSAHAQATIKQIWALDTSINSTTNVFSLTPLNRNVSPLAPAAGAMQALLLGPTAAEMTSSSTLLPMYTGNLTLSSPSTGLILTTIPGTGGLKRATVRMTGTFSVGGTLTAGRFFTAIKKTLTQFPTIHPTL